MTYDVRLTSKASIQTFQQVSDLLRLYNKKSLTLTAPTVHLSTVALWDSAAPLDWYVQYNLFMCYISHQSLCLFNAPKGIFLSFTSLLLFRFSLIIKWRIHNLEPRLHIIKQILCNRGIDVSITSLAHAVFVTLLIMSVDSITPGKRHISVTISCL